MFILLCGDHMIYLCLFLASFIWGMNIVVMKLLLINVHFLTLALLRVFVSLLFIFVYMLFKRMSFYYKDIFKVFIIAFFSIYLNFFFTFLAMSHLNGVQIVFINTLVPIITILLSYIYKERFHKIDLLSAFICFLSFLISISFQFQQLNISFVYMLLGLGCYSYSHILVKKMKIDVSIIFVFYQLLFGSIMLFIHCILTNNVDLHSLVCLNMKQWVLFMMFSGFGFAYIQVVNSYSINKVGVMLTSAFLSLNPVVTYIGSIIFLNENITLNNIVGVFMIVGSLCLSCYIKIRTDL